MWNHRYFTVVSILSGQRNLMKTYHNEANTGGITKIALKILWSFSDKVDRFRKFTILQPNFGNCSYLHVISNCALINEVRVTLSPLSEKVQKNFQCNFCDSTSITLIVISFHQIPLTWWNAYRCPKLSALGLTLTFTLRMSHCTVPHRNSTYSSVFCLFV